MDRRYFLTTGGAAALSLPFLAGCTTAGVMPSPMVPVRPLQDVTTGGLGDAALNELFQRVFDDQIQHSPTYATFLGLDKGANAALKRTFDPKPYPVSRAENVARTRGYIASLEAADPGSLSPAAALNREVVLYDLKTSIAAAQTFDLDSAISPYVWSQQDGAYFSVPDFLANAHTVDTASDAEAYLARLAEFPALLDFETAEAQRQAARGYVAPGWSLDLVTNQMHSLRDPAAGENGLVTSLVTRATKAKLAGDWAARATAIVGGQVYPALDRQLAVVKQLRAVTPAGDGAARLPRGAEIYAMALAQATTTTYSPAEVHALGLQQVAEISAQLDPLLKEAGFATGSVGDRLTALNKSPSQLYPNDDAGRLALIASLNAGVTDMAARLPRAFATIPDRKLEIRRVPVEIQEGAPNGYYNPASIDGTRPAIYYINLKSTADWPKYSLPALTFHEGVPGHHLQGSISQLSESLPMIRRNSFYSGYGEGWALYAEQLADELGAYKGIERAGYLQSYLFRAARLVVDTGLNNLNWSRDKAVDYMVATTGFNRPRVQREVERYCASIGQACSYKIGHIAWNRARTEAQRTLGAKFDLKQFHEVLKDGALPLTILDRRIKERTAEQLARG